MSDMLKNNNNNNNNKTTPTTTVRPFNSLFSRTTWISQHQKGQTSLDLNKARDDGVCGCSGSDEPYANNLHLAPDR